MIANETDNSPQETKLTTTGHREAFYNEQSSYHIVSSYKNPEMTNLNEKTIGLIFAQMDDQKTYMNTTTNANN